MSARLYFATCLALALTACGPVAPKNPGSQDQESKKGSDQDKAREHAYKLWSANHELRRLELQQTQDRRAQQESLQDAQRELKIAEETLKHEVDINFSLQIKSSEMSLQRSRDYVADATTELEQLTSMYESQDVAELTAELVIQRATRDLERAKTGLKMSEKNHRILTEVTQPRARESLEFTVTQKRRAVRDAQFQIDMSRHTHEKALRDARKAIEDLQREADNKS